MYLIESKIQNWQWHCINYLGLSIVKRAATSITWKSSEDYVNLNKLNKRLYCLNEIFNSIKSRNSFTEKNLLKERIFWRPDDKTPIRFYRLTITRLGCNFFVALFIKFTSTTFALQFDINYSKLLISLPLCLQLSLCKSTILENEMLIIRFVLDS